MKDFNLDKPYNSYEATIYTKDYVTTEPVNVLDINTEKGTAKVELKSSTWKTKSCGSYRHREQHTIKLEYLKVVDNRKFINEIPEDFCI